MLPHLLLPEMREALCNTAARRCLTMNLATDTKETLGMSAADHLRVLREYAPDFTIDVVLADPASVTGPRRLRTGGRDARRRGGVG